MIRQDARALELDTIAIIRVLNGRQDIGLVKRGNMPNNNRLQSILEKRRQRHQIKSEKKDRQGREKRNQKRLQA